MPRRKAAQNAKILPWLSGKLDEREGRFIQVGNSLLLSSKSDGGREKNAFLELSTGARLLYLCMAMESGGRRDFTFPLAAAKKYGFATATFRRYVEELVNGSFIVRVSNKNTRQPNDYSFSFEWKSERR